MVLVVVDSVATALALQNLRAALIDLKDNEHKSGRGQAFSAYRRAFLKGKSSLEFKSREAFVDKLIE